MRRCVFFLLALATLALLVAGQPSSPSSASGSSAVSSSSSVGQAQQSGSSVGLTESLLSGSEQALVPSRLFTRLKQFFMFDPRPHISESQENKLSQDRQQHWHHLVQDLMDILTSPAPIDYCEYNYAVTPLVAEFWNTISNLGFVLVGLWGLQVCYQYSLKLRFWWMALAILLTGIWSAMYHGTLWWISLKLDEVCENLACISMLHAEDKTMLVTIVHSIIASFGILFITAFLFTEIHFIAIILALLKQSHGQISIDVRIKKHVLMSGVFCLCGAICWLSDRLYCSELATYPLQLHACWHIFMALATQQGFSTAVAMHVFLHEQKDAKSRAEQGLPKLTIKDWYGVSYISEKEDVKRN